MLLASFLYRNQDFFAEEENDSHYETESEPEDRFDRDFMDEVGFGRQVPSISQSGSSAPHFPPPPGFLRSLGTTTRTAPRQKRQPSSKSAKKRRFVLPEHLGPAPP